MQKFKIFEIKDIRKYLANKNNYLCANQNLYVEDFLSTESNLQKPCLSN